LAADLVEEVLDVVAHPAGAVAAQIGEVLADLGGVDARPLGQALGGDRADLGLGHLEKAAEVDGKAGDGRLRDPPAGHGADGSELVLAFTKPNWLQAATFCVAYCNEFAGVYAAGRQ